MSDLAHATSQKKADVAESRKDSLTSAYSVIALTGISRIAL